MSGIRSKWAHVDATVETSSSDPVDADGLPLGPRGPEVDQEFQMGLQHLCDALGITKPHIKMGKNTGLELTTMVDDMQRQIEVARNCGRSVDAELALVVSGLELLAIETTLQEGVIRLMRNLSKSMVPTGHSEFLQNRWK